MLSYPQCSAQQNGVPIVRSLTEQVAGVKALIDCDVLIQGTVITVDPERRVFTDGYVAIKDDKIVGVGRARENHEFKGRETLKGSLLVIPGLVNLHGHLVQGVIRGMVEGAGEKRGTRFMAFQFPMTDTLDEEESYVSALPGITELLRSGVTTSEDTHFTNRHKRSVDGVIRAAKESLNGIDLWDVKRSYRYEQGFTFELNLSGVADEHRDAFVEKRDTDTSR